MNHLCNSFGRFPVEIAWKDQLTIGSLIQNGILYVYGFLWVVTHFPCIYFDIQRLKSL